MSRTVCITLVGIASTVGACSSNNNVPCAIPSFGDTPAAVGDAHFSGTVGAFDVASNQGDPIPILLDLQTYSYDPKGVDPPVYQLDIYVTGGDLGKRGYWVHIANMPSEVGAHDLRAAGARACYCPDDHPTGDYSNERFQDPPFGALTPICSSASAAQVNANTAPDSSYGATPACELLAGTLTVTTFTADCVRSNEQGPRGCALTYDVTVDVPKSAGHVSLHVEQTRSDGLSHTTCDEGSTGGPGIHPPIVSSNARRPVVVSE
jgi:hypothetical protein